MLLHAGLPRPNALLQIVLFVFLSWPLLGQISNSHIDSGHESGFAQLDFAQIYMNQEAWQNAEHSRGVIQDDKLAHSGSVSLLDLQAPGKAIKQFNRGIAQLRAQQSKEAIPYLEKAVAIYPEFVSAHVALGMAYFDQQDARATREFQSATTLDDQFPIAFFNLGIMQIASHDYAKAEFSLQRAADLNPSDPKALTILALAQNAAHRYAESLKTAQRVNALDHRGLPNVHYIAAASAFSMHDFITGQKELKTFLQEDPTNPLAPLARKRLEAAAEQSNQRLWETSNEIVPTKQSSISVLQTFPNSEHLRKELGTVTERDSSNCADCSSQPEPILVASTTFTKQAPISFAEAPRKEDLFTIRRAVDETALFIAVTRNGHMVNDLSASDIQILDDNKPPERVLDFIPQSHLPLRIGLLIDTSSSVEHRFLFEQRAAQKFIQSIMNSHADLAFIAGFNAESTVTQDFTGDPRALSKAIERLSGAGDGTSLFDAIDFACRKLADYPEQDRVAKVLVVLTDGEDNSSHRSLGQNVQAAEEAGVSIYTIDTAQDVSMQSDAAKVLQTLADRSGGDALFPQNLRDLDRYLSELPNLIHSRYLIAYKPDHFVSDGKYRTLQVVAVKDGKHLRVHTRKGYYARYGDE